MYALKTKIDKLMYRLHQEGCPQDLKKIADDYIEDIEKINGAPLSVLEMERR